MVALTIISVTALGAMQVSLKQTASVRELYARLQAQILLLNIQSRLSLNKSYIQQKQQQAVYFNRQDQTNCIGETLSWCQSENCDAQRVAELDVMEFICLAKEFGLTLELTLTVNQPPSWGSEITVTIWLTSNRCETQMCKLVEQGIWL